MSPALRQRCSRRDPRHWGYSASIVTETAISSLPPAGPLGVWPCIGRSRSVAAIVAAVSGAPAGRGGRSAFVVAPLGGGKTRVLDEVGSALALTARPIVRIAATTATASLPFAAAAHLLATGTRHADDPVALIGALRDVLAPVGGDRSVVLVDDVPLLDVATAGVVASLALDGRIDVVAAARSGESVPGPLVDVLLGDRALVVDLAPLTDDDIDTVLHLALGGPVDSAAMLLLRERCAGNPLFLRELTRGAVESGALVEVGGVWRLRGVPGSTPRLRDVVESRLEGISPASRPALELLALCEAVDLDELESLVGLEALTELEARGLLRAGERGGHQVAMLGHPLHGEAIRAALPAVRARLVLRGHLGWLAVNAPEPRRDPLREAIWRLDAGLGADVEELRNGVRLAARLQDSPSVLRLGLPAFEREPTAEVGRLLADALYHAGRFEECIDVIDRTTALPSPPELRMALAITKATLLLWGAGEPDAAVAAVDDALGSDGYGAEHLARLRVERASILVNAGRPAEARDALDDAAASDHLTLRLAAAVPHAMALAMAGHTDAAVAVVDRGLAARPPDVALPGVPDDDAFQVARCFALAEGGRLDEALARAQAAYAEAVGARRLLKQFWASLLLGRIHLYRGQPASALRMFRDARALGIDGGLRGPSRTALIGVAVSAGLLNDPTAARSALVELDAAPEFGFLAPERALAVGWVAAAEGDRARARAALLAGVDEALGSGHVTSAVWLLHEAARLGGASELAEQAASLAEHHESSLVAVRARHITALAGGTAAALTAVADDALAIGAQLIAAEALVAAAAAGRAAGDQRGANALTARAERILAGCEGAQTASLITAPAAVDPLTEREREIAFLAAGGATSKQIAERLFLSLRTVNNHLQHVYDKLGARGRVDLRAALGLEER